MSTSVASVEFQPPRKEKSKFQSNNSAECRASCAEKNRHKTKSTSVAHRRHCHRDRPPNFAAVRRVEARRAALKKSRGPAPKRGDVKAAIFKDVVDATWGYLCAAPTATRDAEAFLDSVPLPTKREPMAHIWPKIGASVLQE